MKIAYFNGGLGNQTFQYIFARYIELTTNTECYLDDSFFFEKKQHNGYELEKVFGVKPKLLSQCFTEDVWKAILEQKKSGISMAQVLKDNGMDIMMIKECGEPVFDGNVLKVGGDEYSPVVAAVIQGNVYYHGYWINKNWFRLYKDILLKELQFPKITDERNLQYQKAITENFSVGVHIRRGDFVSLGWEISPEIYYNAMKKIAENFPKSKYFIFSDDIIWCQEHEKELGFEFADGNIEYVVGNVGEKSYIDMQLLSMCNGIVIANSSFSYLAALLNTVQDKFFMNLSQWESII